MEAAVVMIDWKENNNVKRGRWPSLCRCTYSLSRHVWAIKLMNISWYQYCASYIFMNDYFILSGLILISSSNRCRVRRKLEPFHHLLHQVVLLQLQTKISGKFWSLDFLLKAAQPRYSLVSFADCPYCIVNVALLFSYSYCCLFIVLRTGRVTLSSLLRCKVKWLQNKYIWREE